MIVTPTAVWRHTRHNGVTATLHRALYRMSESWYERRLRISTSRVRQLAEFGIHDRSLREYSPLSYLSIRLVLKSLAVPAHDSALVEYGCGMGRVVVMAATYPFRSITGVELVPELAQMAVDNVNGARRRLSCRNIEIVTGDAAGYEIPDSVTVFFFFNPFGGETLTGVFQRIRRSLISRPRKHQIVYVRPPGTGSGWVGEQVWLSCRQHMRGANDEEIYFFEMTDPH